VVNSGQAFAEPAFSLFKYDDRNQLTAASRYLGSDINDLSNPVQPENRSYDYDPIGNRKQALGWDTIASSAETETYTANALNQYKQITTENGSASGGTTDNLIYDLDGNLTAIVSLDSTKLYKYNAENRLIAVEPQLPIDGDNKLEYIYDYIGRRTQMKVYSYSSGHWNLKTTKIYIYNGWNVVKEVTTDSTQSATFKHYIWGMDLSQSFQGASGVGGLIAAVNGSLTHYFCYDASGNVSQLVKSHDGNLAAHYEYDPFGNKLVANGKKLGVKS
jgi:hypothetical protein